MMDRQISLGKIADELTSRDKRIYVYHTKNGGVSIASNFGLEKATGQYVTFVDGDDYLELDAYEKCISIFNSNAVDAIRFNLANEENGKSSPQPIGYNSDGIISKDEIADLFIKYKLLGSACCFITKRALIGDLSFREDTHLGEDLLFNMELFMKANRVYFMTQCLYHYVTHQESVTNKPELFKRNCCEFINNFFLTSEILDKYIGLTKIKKKLLATSRFNHLNSRYFNRMLTSNQIDDIVEILTQNEQLEEMLKYVKISKLKPFRAIVFVLAKLKAKHVLRGIFLFKENIIKT